MTAPGNRMFINVTVSDSLADFSKLSEPKSNSLKVSFGCKEESKHVTPRTALYSVHSASGTTNKKIYIH